MSEDDLIPAINVQNEIPNELSAQEFQKQLYAWFENRGIMSNLKTYLRKELIEALKETQLGKTVSSYQKPTVSPKLQALNLLVAEYLLNQNYNYSVSVFVTEVPLVNVFSEFSTGVLDKKEIKRWKFNEKDVWDILESLGVPSTTEDGKRIFATYFQLTNKESLLLCIIRMLNSFQGQQKGSNELIFCERTNQRSLENLVELLISHNVNRSCMDQILETIEAIIVSEQTRIKAEAKEEYVKLQGTLEQAAVRIQKEQSKKIDRIQSSLDLEKSKLESEMVRHQTKLSNFQNEIQHNRKLLNERCRRMVMKEKEMEVRETNIKQKETQLKTLQEQLEMTKQMWEEKHQKIVHLQKKLQNEGEYRKGSNYDCKLAQDSSDNENLKADGNEENLKRMEALRAENSILKHLSNRQQRKINKLAQNNSVHERELENARTTIGHFNSSYNLSPTNHVTLAGAGEEIFRPTTALEYTTYINQHDSAKVPQRRSAHSSSSSEEHTMNVLQEAKLRLQRLEKESADVDRRYRRFKRNNSIPNWLDGIPSTSRANEDPTKGEVTKSDSLSQLKCKLLKDKCQVGSNESLCNNDESIASSGLADLLAAGTSGVSMSDFEITAGDKTDEQVDEKQDDR